MVIQPGPDTKISRQIMIPRGEHTAMAITLRVGSNDLSRTDTNSSDPASTGMTVAEGLSLLRERDSDETRGSDAVSVITGTYCLLFFFPFKFFTLYPNDENAGPFEHLLVLPGLCKVTG